VPTYQPLGQSRDDVRQSRATRRTGNERCRDRSRKGLNRGLAILDLAETLVKLPRLDSNQQPFGLSRVLCSE
jgi:hypothetical protein